MTMETAISIVTPAYRAEGFLARAVASVLAQTRRDFEMVIAADDGQDYLAILQAQGLSDPRLKCVGTGGVGTGAAHARNCALNAAHGRIIAGLDADDAFLPDHLARLVPLAVEHGVAISQIDLRDHETASKLPNRAQPQAEGLLPLENALQACLHTYAPIVFDRDKIDQRWNESVPPLEDAVFLAECCTRVPVVWYQATPTYCYFRRSDSLCNAAGAAARFLEAGKRITDLVDRGGIAPSNPRVREVLRAYVRRSDALEHAFAQALEQGTVSDYQDFIGRNLDLLHAPLLG